jgi:hypothetical protein
VTRTRLALALGAACGTVAAVLIYALLRAAQLFSLEPNPATVIWSAHSGYYWRIWTTVFAAGMLAVLAYLAARRDAEQVARALPPATAVAATALALQALLAP